MFYRRNPDTILLKTGGQAGVANRKWISLYRHGLREIRPAKHDSCVRSSRPKRQIHLLTGMQSYTGRPDHVFQRTLSDHRKTSCVFI
jgi:hypothetical protein